MTWKTMLAARHSASPPPMRSIRRQPRPSDRRITEQEFREIAVGKKLVTELCIMTDGTLTGAFGSGEGDPAARSHILAILVKSIR